MSKVIMKKPLIKGPLLKVISKLNYHGVDMHFHTEFSMDAVSKIDAVLEKCKKTGMGVAITDHNEIKGALEAFKKKDNQFIIPGTELVCHRGVHLTLYFYDVKELKKFYDKEVKPRKKKNPFFLPIKVEKMLKIARKYNCVTCVPHPFGPGVIGIKKMVKVTKEMLNNIDLVEGVNGACFNHENKKAVKWAKKVNKGISAGTDGHTTPQLGKVLCFSRGKTVKEFLDNAKKGKTICIGKRENMFLDIVHTLKKFITEEKKEKGRLLRLYEARYRTEHDYLLYKLKKDKEFLLHIFLHHSHHSKLSKKHQKILKKHKHYKHVLKKRKKG